MSSAKSLIRPLVRRLHAYVPGEQPQIPGLVKLNTNENPYPPSPRVRAAVRRAVDGRLRLYPNPTAQPLRQALARLHGCAAENLIIGNGSDELLALATRAFVEPAAGVARGSGRAVVQYFVPSYSLYPVLGEIHGAVNNPVPLRPDFSLPTVRELRQGKQWRFDAALTYITTPNAPTGQGYALSGLEAICRAQRGVVILDEAYVDFAPENALALALRHDNVMVSRTFSKAYSLCFQRIGYFVGPAPLIAALDKIRDSYNVNGLGQVAALATLEDLDYYRRNFQKVIATRAWLSQTLTRLGFAVLPSHTNFIFTRPPRYPAGRWLEELRARKVLVRWWDMPEVRDYLRITIGTRAEAQALVQAATAILHGGREGGSVTGAPDTRG